MDKQNRNILAGVVVIVAVLVIFNMSQDNPIQTNQIVTPTGNTGVVDGTQITCPDGFTVVSTMGGTPEQPQLPQCKAPNPSVEVFDCNDTLVDVDGTMHTIECVALP